MSQRFKDLGELIGKAEVLQRLDITAWMLDKMVELGDFPAPIEISARTHKWQAKELDAWLDRAKKKRKSS